MKLITIEKDCPEYVYMGRDNVTYGTIEHKVYHSKTTGLDRGVNIILPANYSDTKKYPVLYMLHGIFGDENTFINDENIHLINILGNLVEDKKAKEMIVVLPNIYAKTDEDQKPEFKYESTLPYNNFINDLVNDLIPYIEKNYSVKTERKDRAILGFSMGGRETLYIGLTRPDLFANMGAISPAPGLTPGKDWAMTHLGQMKEDELHFNEEDELPELLLVCCGTDDRVVGKFPESYHSIMVTNHVEHIWYEIPGADHDAVAIRSGINNFIRNIF